MSHTPPLPVGAQSPYPLHKPEAADRDHARHGLAEKAASNLKTKADAVPAANRWPRYAAGAAIGSAAIVAGLLYYNRPKAR